MRPALATILTVIACHIAPAADASPPASDTDRIAALRAENARLLARVAELETENASLTALTAPTATDADPGAAIPENGRPPATAHVATGLVVATRDNRATQQQDLVMASFPSTSRPADGAVLLVLRNGRYLVSLRVARVMDDMAACRILPETWAMAGERLRSGDAVRAAAP